MNQLPALLLERLRLRQVALVAGLGCAEAAGLPGWRALVSRLIERLPDETGRAAVHALWDARRPMAALGWLREALGEETVASVLAAACPPGRPLPAGLAQAARIPWRAVVTCGFDDLWSRALAPGTPVVLPGTAFELAQARGSFLLHLRGLPSVPGTLCLGPREVRTRLAAPGPAAVVAEAARRWSLVLVGFASDDPDLALVGERLLGAGGGEAEHFLLCPGLAPEEAAALGVDLGLTALALPGTVDETLAALAAAWSAVEGASRPAEDDVEGWFELWKREPGDPEPRAVLERAAARLRAEGQWERLVELLVHRAELVTEPREQVAALHEVGRVLERELGAAERAYPALVTALRLDPQNHELLEDAKRAAGQTGNWEDFLREYGGLVEEIADPTDSARHVVEIGRIYAEKVGRLDEAIATYERALSLDPQSGDALAALERLYRQAERWRDLARVLEARERRAEAAEARILRRTRAEILCDKVGDRPAAIAALEAVTADDPGDLRSLRTLIRLYEEEGREPDRLAALERLLDRAAADDERLAIARRIAAGWRAHSATGERAVAAAARAFTLGDRDEATLEFLAGALEPRGRWRELAEVLDRWAEITADGRARAERLARAGRIFAEALADPAAGEARYARALEHDPGHPTVLAALAAFCRARGDHLRAAKFLVEAEARTGSPLEKARLLYDAGVLHQDHLEDEAAASALYGRALDADPEHLGAAERLAGLHERAGAHAALEPLLDRLVRKADPGDPGRAAALHGRLAACARAQGKIDKALRQYEAARALTPDAPALLRELGDLRFERGEWAEAKALYEALRRAGRGAATPPDERDLFPRLATCEAHLGDAAAALALYEEALALEPGNRLVLAAMAELQASRGDHEAELEARRRLLTLLAGEEKARLAEEIGDLLRGPLGRPAEAVGAYQEALGLDPRRRQTLHRLLDLYTEQKRWESAAEMLARLHAIESDRAVRAKYSYAAAAIERDELGHPTEAVVLFNQALDDDPSLWKAFEAAERLLVEAQDGKGLERHYRRMIKRLGAEGPVDERARLWAGLADVALRSLGDREMALLALEVATSLDRENYPRQELLGELYLEAGPSAVEKAIAQHQLLIARRPDRLDSYWALARAFRKAQAYDKLWCVAGALVYLGQADSELTSFWERHRQPEVPVASGKLSEELWAKIVHPREEPLIGAIFRLLAPAMAAEAAQTHQAVGLKRGERIDVGRSDWFPAIALRYVSATLEVQLPDVFVRERDPQTLALLNLKEKTGLTPALVIGQGFAQWATQWEVVFDVAKRLALLRWERYPRFALLTPAALEVALRAALALGGVSLAPGLQDGEIDRASRRLGQMIPRPVVDQVAVFARQLLEARGEAALDVAGWIGAADLTAARAAFVVSSDLPAAVQVLQAEPAAASPVPLGDRIKDLLAYSVSEEFFAVRQALGLQAV